MYKIPSDCTDVKVIQVSKNWVLSYVHEGIEKSFPLFNGHLPSTLSCVNIWNTAAFVSTSYPEKPFRFPFGKHIGKTVEEVPSSYIDWWMNHVLQELPAEN